MGRICGTLKTDDTTLTMVDGVLTQPGKTPTNVKTAPCGHFKLDADLFTTLRGAKVTKAGTEGSGNFTNLCGTLSLDNEVFTMNKGVIGLIPEPEEPDEEEETDEEDPGPELGA